MVCCLCAPTIGAALASVVVLCSECCNTLFDITSPIISQCCECGVFLNGEYEGLVVLSMSGTPNIRCCSTHGMCRACADEKLAAWHILKALRKGTSSAA